jgi:hypothetical protein
MVDAVLVLPQWKIMGRLDVSHELRRAHPKVAAPLCDKHSPSHNNAKRRHADNSAEFERLRGERHRWSSPSEGSTE